MLGGASRASELQGEQRSVWRPIAHLAHGRARYFAGEPREAIVPLERAARLAVRKKQWLVASTSKAILARALLDVGDEGAAESAAGEAVELTQLHDLGERPGSGCAYMALGAVRARTGNLDEAEPLLSTGLTRLRAQGEELYIAEALLTLAPVWGSQGERKEARGLLAEAGEVLEGCPDPGILRARLEDAARTLTPAHRRIDGDSELTEREREVLEYLAQGLSKRETGKALFLSFNTIHSHTKSIYQKLRVSSRAAAVERARELGAIDAPRLQQPNSERSPEAERRVQRANQQGAPA
jgi:LuxR family maltose regulon positive regulatory protein